jgi:hypothetical protein
MHVQNQPIASIFGDRDSPSSRQLLPNDIHPADHLEKDPFMIDEVSINNFRCFKHLEVPCLKRVNLLVGPNSSGKSAFLESVFLASSSLAAQTSLQFRTIRKMGNQFLTPTDEQTYRGIWQDLFYDFADDKKFSIKVSGNPNSDSRIVSAEYTRAFSQELPFERQDALPSGGAQFVGVMPQIEFKWKRNGFPQIVHRPTFTKAGLNFDPNAEVSYFPVLWFTPGTPDTPDEHAKRFSVLDQKGAIDPVKDIMRKEFDFIKDLSIQYHAGMPMVFADVEGKSRKMPVALLSDGVNRLLGICLGIAYYRGGTILIDQLEDGFHHKLLPAIWSSIYTLAEQCKVQLFVSTHSNECLRAMLHTLKGHEEDFCLLRAHRLSSGGCSVDSLPGSYLETALEQNFEVR